MMYHETESKSDRAFRTFVEVMTDVHECGTGADRQLALEAIDAIVWAWFSDSQTRALIGAITRSILSGELDADAQDEFRSTVEYMEENK
jgi:hypothetical protein